LAHFDSEIISQTIGAQSSRVPTSLPDDPYVSVKQANLVDTNTESKPVEDLRETETLSLSQRRLPQRQSSLRILSHRTLRLPHHIPQPKVAALSPSSFRKRYRSSYETPSPSSSLILPIRKRYREDKGPGSEDEGPGSGEEEDEAAPEGQQQAVPTKDTYNNP
nr:hypothetical protein [Tanacetum cinerariifolium]